MKMNNFLNELLADLNQMLMLTYQVHWYMRGKGFLVYHPMLDSYIEEYQDDIDEVAENLIMLGGSPFSTLEEMANNTKLEITAGDYGVTIEAQLEKLLAGLKYFQAKCQEGMELAEEENLVHIVDLCSDMLASTNKHIWMLNAELGKAPNA